MGQTFKNILRSLKMTRSTVRTEDPMVVMRKRKAWITRLAYRYFTSEQALAFDKLYNSKYVWDNRQVKHVVKLLITKYKQERKQWLERKRY